jgi:hypothetical protein
MNLTKQIKRGQSAVEKFGEYKMEVINRCLSSDKITKLLAYDAPDALFRDSVEEKYSLLYKRIFPYRFVPDPIENQGTFITIGMQGFKPSQSGYKVYDDYLAGDLWFYVFTHVDLMRTDNGVRQDLIIAEIDRLFNGKEGIGMGELRLRHVNELWIHNNKFGGYSVGYTISDFK